MPQSNSTLPDTLPTVSNRAAPTEPVAPARNGRSRTWKDSLKWTRLLHVYSSMIALLLVLFFGLTGLTLNHPDWDLGFGPTVTNVSGEIPAEAFSSDGSVEFLAVSEFLRAEYNLKGNVSDFGADNTEGFISYRGAGYAADIFFDIDTGEFELTAEEQGWIGVMNDLHKGRDTGTTWSWVIDVSAVFLVFVALTGLGLQLFLTKRRKSALAVAAAGLAISVILTLLAVG